MADGDEDLSPSRDLQFTMEEDCHHGEEVNDDDVSEIHPVEHSERMLLHRDELDSENGVAEGKKVFVPPAARMEFETYDDAYNYYNCYAKEVGFRVRVKNSWFKRNSKEKYGAVLCCSSQGFKRIKDAHRLRKETRTGCPAMIRMRLLDSKRWRLLEVILEHNHLLGVKHHKSAKKMEIGTKRKVQSDVQAQKLKIYRPLLIDAGGIISQASAAREVQSSSEQHPTQLGFKKGDGVAIYNYLCRMQLTNPSFFYLMDFGDEGVLKNVFWVDARSRAACCHFNDVVFLDNTYLANKYEIPLVVFVGINHHGQSVLLGCGLLSGETTESYMWLFKSWLKCLSGHPQTIITDRCKALENAISEVFPGTHHRFGVSHIMRKAPEKLGGVCNYEGLKKALSRAVYGTMKVIEFEAAWAQMVQYFGVMNDEWLSSLFEERARWAPVYSRDVFFAGISTSKADEILYPFFDKFIHKQTPLKEFLDKYELALYKKNKEETLADIESQSSSLVLKTRCPFESQLSKIYTRGIFHKFQLEVEEMYSCFSTTQLHVNGPNAIFLVKERFLHEGNRREIRDFEVLFNSAVSEVCCICNCFNLNGFLCRHALSVLNFNGIDEIPPRYVLSRWKKDYKRAHVIDHDGNKDNVRFNQLFTSALQVVEEGSISLEHYEIALQAIEDSLSRVHDVEESSNGYFRSTPVKSAALPNSPPPITDDVSTIFPNSFGDF